MRRLRQWINQLSIKKKLVFYSYLIITPILLCISGVLVVRNYRTSLKEEDIAYIQGVRSLSENIGAVQKSIMELGTYVCINNDITQILDSREPWELNQDSQLWTHKAPMKIIQDMMALSGNIKTIAIYPENGVRPYLRCMDASAYISTLEEVQKTEIYKEAVMRRGKTLWQYAAKSNIDTYENNRENKLVMYREIYDLSQRKKMGYLVIGASADKLQTYCEEAIQSEEEGIVVVTREGTELFRAGEIEGTVLDEILQYSLTQADRKELSGKSDIENCRLYYCKNEETGTIVYKTVPKQGIGASLYDIAFTPAALLLGFLAGLWPILIFVSNVVSKPLHKLCQAMEAFKGGDFNQKVEVNTSDEVGMAAECFNSMVEDIRSLIDNNYVMALREKESELNALQAQINPHFLYNTLDSLYWQAQGAGNEKIAEDILALSQLFRMVLGQGKGIVTVQEEENLIEQYLHIQKMRFERKLDYEIDMEEEILQEVIPKLILQPFVENAIVHGFEKAGENCFLSVTGRKTGDYMEFRISDTGIGMTKEQIEGMFNVADAKRYSGQRVGRYAVKNIKERLELKYHGNFKLKIESEPGKGTTVILKVPLENKEGSTCV